MNNDKVHPVSLTIKDETQRAAFIDKQRTLVLSRVNRAACLLWFFLALELLLHWSLIDRELNFVLTFFPLTISLTLVAVIARCWPAFIDFTCVTVLVITGGTFVFLNYAITEQLSYFAVNDVKELHGMLEFAMIPALLFSIVQWRVDAFVTVPATIILSIYSTMTVFTTEDDNLIGFKHGEQVATILTVRSAILLVIICCAIYVDRRTLILDFIKTTHAVQQQEFLKGVFDQQACGILILSEPLEKPKPAEVQPEMSERQMAQK